MARSQDSRPWHMGLSSPSLARLTSQNANLVHYSRYSEAELLPTAQLMLDYVSPSMRRSADASQVVRSLRLPEPEHPCLHRKYAAKKYFRASELCADWAERRYKVSPARSRALTPHSAQPSTAPSPLASPSASRSIPTTPRSSRRLLFAHSHLPNSSHVARSVLHFHCSSYTSYRVASLLLFLIAARRASLRFRLCVASNVASVRRPPLSRSLQSHDG